MKIFISWSGAREQAVAEALQGALPELCAAKVEVFVSSRSIAKGTNGLDAIESNRDSSAFGLVLVSRANQAAPWLNYEAGWLASALDRPVATVCLDLRPSDITTPLAPKQATQFDDAEDMKRLLREIVQLANPDMSDRAFNALLADVWSSVRDSWVVDDATAQPEPARTESDMLAEVVERVRRIEEGIEANGRPLPQPIRRRTAAYSQSNPSLTFLRDVERLVDFYLDRRGGLVECSLDDATARVTVAVDSGVPARLIRSLRDELGLLVPGAELVFRSFRRVDPGDVEAGDHDDRGNEAAKEDTSAS